MLCCLAELGDTSRKTVALFFKPPYPPGGLYRDNRFSMGCQKSHAGFDFLPPNDARTTAVAFLMDHQVEFARYRRRVRENELGTILRQVAHQTIDCGTSVVERDPPPQIGAAPMYISPL
jgi:hypothetical protein